MMKSSAMESDSESSDSDEQVQLESFKSLSLKMGAPMQQQRGSAMMQEQLSMPMESKMSSMSMQQQSFQRPPPAEYQQILNNQDSEGFWSDQQLDLVLALLDDSQKASLKKLLDNESNKCLALTITILSIFKDKFRAQKQEWTMIERKAQRWIKSQDGHDHVQDKVNDALQGEKKNYQQICQWKAAADQIFHGL